MLTVVRWIHLVAASVWLGGLVFVIIVLRAPVQAAGAAEGLDALLVRFRQRYKGLLIATVVALAASGIAALVLRHARLDALYVILLIAKILLSVGVVALFWYAAFVRQGPRAVVSDADDGVAETEAAELSDAAKTDADYFFRPKTPDARMQWAIVGATVAVILLGLIVAQRGVRLAERDRQSAPALVEESSR